MFVVFYTVNWYICVFMTCSTSCCLYDTLMDPWNVCMYVCMNKNIASGEWGSDGESMSFVKMYAVKSTVYLGA